MNEKIKYIKAKTLLSHVRGNDTWFGLSYNMNLYRGCQHRCIYCDTRSMCYGVDHFDKEIHVKENALELLRKELPRKRRVGTIGFGSMNDPYMPVEKELNLTGEALKIVSEFNFPIHIITKSALVVKDIRTLAKITKVYAAVSFTVITDSDEEGLKLEPYASPISKRFESMSLLSSVGVHTGVTLMPVLPFITDREETIKNIVRLTKEHGGSYITASFGMTLRDRQRAYYYNKLDEIYPKLDLREKYIKRFKNYYQASSPKYKKLKDIFYNECEKYGIRTRMPIFKKPLPGEDWVQETLF